jgi:hypothetical protein
MGFFSANCPGCNHSIRSSYSVREASRWMKSAVLLSKGNKPVKGEYDGYGCINSMDEDDSDGFLSAEVWHHACWEIAGKPSFTKTSAPDSDQGYFVGEYDPPKPISQADLDALKAAAKIADDERREEGRKSREKYLAELVASGKPIPTWMTAPDAA